MAIFCPEQLKLVKMLRGLITRVLHYLLCPVDSDLPDLPPLFEDLLLSFRRVSLSFGPLCIMSARMQFRNELEGSKGHK
jgi:hypothetical protein